MDEKGLSMNEPNNTQFRRLGIIIGGIVFLMILLVIMVFFFRTPQLPTESPSDTPWLGTITEIDKAEATEIHDIVLNFRPVVIGDPITGAEYRYVSESSCWTWGITTAVGVSGSIFCR